MFDLSIYGRSQRTGEALAAGNIDLLRQFFSSLCGEKNQAALNFGAGRFASIFGAILPRICDVYTACTDRLKDVFIRAYAGCNIRQSKLILLPLNPERSARISEDYPSIWKHSPRISYSRHRTAFLRHIMTFQAHHVNEMETVADSKATHTPLMLLRKDA
ncbi:MAG: hypothetical protein ABJ327_13090 [Litoreibacter sp.]